MRDFYFRPKFILKQVKNLRFDNINMYISGAYALFKSKFE